MSINVNYIGYSPLQNQVVPGGNGGPGWGPAGFEGGGSSPADWASSPARSSPPSWPGQSSAAEKRPAPSSVSAYGFDDDDDEEEEDDAGAVVVGEGPAAVQCQPSATKRSRRSLVGGGSKKRMKGSPLVSSSAVVGVPKSAVGVANVVDRGAQGVQGAVAAALAASRPSVAPSPPMQGCSSWGNGMKILT